MTAAADDEGAPALPPTDPLFDDLPCGLLVTRDDGLVHAINDTLCQWLGRTSDEVVGRLKFQDMLTMGSRIFHQTHWAPLLQLQGSVSEVKLEMAARGGARLPVIVNAVRQTHADGMLHKIALFVLEERHLYERELLTARRRAEQALEAERQANKALQEVQAELEALRAKAEDRAKYAEQMMGIVSHDLRNPLAVIDLCVQTLSKGTLPPDKAKTLDVLSRSNGRALRLISDLLDFTQVRMGSALSLAVRPMDLHAVVAETVAELQLANPRHRLVHVRHGDGACTASADRLVQAIGNLVGNAVQHGANDGVITVTSSNRDGICSVTVHNEGDPVPAELMPRIFEPLVRGGGEGAAAGVGLGLYIVREIARSHDGEVAIESTDGKGTVIMLRFPATPVGTNEAGVG
jgi:sigma-B regulation protein RsbU (phosphoserine phosphatase)